MTNNATSPIHVALRRSVRLPLAGPFNPPSPMPEGLLNTAPEVCGSTNGCGPPGSTRLARWPPKKLAEDEVSVNGLVAKASQDVRPGDVVLLRQGPVQRTVQVLALSTSRGPAPGAVAVCRDA